MVEVLVVFVIIAILVSIALPGFIVWLPTYRLKRATRDLLSNFQLAKLSAIRNHLPCTVTFRNGMNGITLGGTLYDYVVYIDADMDLEYDSDATGDGIDNDNDGTVDEAGESEVVIARVLFADYGLNIGFDTAQGGGDGVGFDNNDNGRPSVAFLPTGLTRANGSSNPVAGTVSLISTRNNKTTAISISVAGSVGVN